LDETRNLLPFISKIEHPNELRYLTMVRFQCDSCGKLKETNGGWILGLAAENIGITSARREISIAATWERARAVDPLAVHFCSNKCRADYMGALFAESPETLQGEATVARRRIKRFIPGAVVDTVVTEKTRPAVVKQTTKRKKTA
jgi:hypothetical protein